MVPRVVLDCMPVAELSARHELGVRDDLVAHVEERRLDAVLLEHRQHGGRIRARSVVERERDLALVRPEDRGT